MKQIFLLIILISCAYNPTAARYVIDGDTFVLNNGDTIRLQGIDTPEQGDINYDKTAFELQDRLIGKKLTFEGTTDDLYGRKVRFVFSDGKNVNVEMVREGWATAFMHKGTKYEQEIELAQHEARIARKGVWNINDESYKRLSRKCAELGCPSGTIAVASKQGEVFYNCACSATNLISKENIQCFTAIEDAIAQGLREARKC
ncbi:Staphylococcal nuclease homologue [uncultured archaeon]|nr:Staphylococcal nuclease homologue [uncultured archaeon]